MELDQEALEYYLHQLMVVQGVSQAEAASKVKLHASTVSRKFKSKFDKKDYKPPEVSIERLKILLSLLSDDKEDDTSRLSESFSIAIRMMHNGLKLKEAHGYIISDERRVTIPIKVILDCIEKCGKHLKTMSEAADVSKKGLSLETIDYREMAKFYITFDDNTGKFKYDAREHMKAVLDRAHNKKKDEE